MLAEDLQIYKDTRQLALAMLTYQKNVSRMVRFGAYQQALDRVLDALDIIRKANETFEGRADRLLTFVHLISEAKTRVSLLAEAKDMSVRQATNLLFIMERKVLPQGMGWLKKSGGARREP